MTEQASVALMGAWVRLNPQLRRYLAVNMVAMTVCCVGMMASIVAGIHASRMWQDLWVLLAAIAAHLLLAALLMPRYGGAGAVISMLVSSLIAVLGLTWVTPFMGPLTVLVPLVPLMVAHPYLGSSGRKISTLTVVAAMAGAAVLSEWRRPADDATLVTSMVSLGFSIPIVAVVIAQSVRQNYRILSEQADELRRSRRDVVAVADAARRSLERDLHDGAQQRLIGMSVQMARLEELLGDGDLSEARRLVDSLRADNLEAVSELRELARGLYPPLLRDRGLVPALEAVALRSPVACRVSIEALPRYEDAVEAAVYFCVVESLQNAAHHSGATSVQVSVRPGPVLAFEVADDGAGFTVSEAPPTGGLLGMSARVAAAGGSLKIDSTLGVGTRVSGTFPDARPVTTLRS